LPNVSPMHLRAQDLANSNACCLRRWTSTRTIMPARREWGASAQDGVIDPDCCVFGADDVYVAGASVFPTAGYANPVLTIVALAIRLADRLKQRL